MDRISGVSQESLLNSEKYQESSIKNWISVCTVPVCRFNFESDT